jgi:hypothetical protein
MPQLDGLCVTPNRTSELPDEVMAERIAPRIADQAEPRRLNAM